jgi:hypothetical protein
MHFATGAQDTGTDSAVWMVDYRQAHDLLPGALRRVLREEGADLFTVEMLSRAVPDLEALDSLSPEPFIVFFEPPSLDQRIVAQAALFSVCSDSSQALGDWIEGHSELASRIVIPAGLRAEIRDKLDQANITERVLFPGLDGLARWLRRYYSPGLEPDRGWHAG